MGRLSTRLVVSHLLVTVLGAATTYITVRLLAPRMFDDQLGLGQGVGQGQGRGAGRGAGGGAGSGAGTGFANQLRDQFATAVDNALLVGALVGIVAAAAFGVLAARRLGRPIDRVRDATRAIASGRYDTRVPTPAESDLRGLADDVNALAGTLEETETRRVRLLGEVAHELRTPLTVLDGTLEGMIDGVLPTTPDQLDALAGEVRRMRRLSDDLSTLSRSAEGRLTITPRPTDLRAVAVAAAERLRPQAEDAGLTLVCGSGGADEPATPVRVTADPERLAQVVTNLVGNAVRATPAGGRVTVEILDAPGPAVRVSDTGEGIADDDLPKIFERFYRVPGGRGGDGSGIGLTISRAIMRAHGGDLVASSPGRGRGATFTATLPRG